MRNFDDEEYFLFKSLSNSVIAGVSPALDKLAKQCEKLILEIEEIDRRLEKAETGAEINELSKVSQEKRKELIKLLAIKNRIAMLIKRNKSRISYIEKILKNAGIYNEAFDKKKISEVEKQESENISEDTLNLNVYESTGDELESKFFEGEIIALFNGKLNFSLPENKEVLAHADDEYMSKIIKTFPDSVSTITVDTLSNTTVKKRALKAIATYVIDETRKKDIKQVNKELGNLLEFKTEITATAEDYVAGVTNMFNAQVKAYLLENSPEKAEEIKGKLKCNEKSELIPESKRVAILAAGVAGDIMPEAEESEEMRIAREKEMQEKNNVNMAMQSSEIAQEQAEENEMLQKIDEIEQLMKEEQERENIKEQERKQKAAEEELEMEEMQMQMSKNKYDD